MSERHQSSYAAVVLAMASLVLAACTTSGTGTAIARAPGQPGQEIVFYWDAGTDPTAGSISTVLPDGEVYRGQFVQITAETDVDSISPFYHRWYGGWGYGWDAAWWPGPFYDDISSYVTVYSGRVLATLRSPQGNTMRCQFRLSEPRAGLAGGGIGECRTSEGTAIEAAVFSPDEDRGG